MQLGKSLVGAIIGGALGIAVLWFVQHHHGWDDYWMAIPVALLTGLGVRFVANVKGHPSYLRGALIGLLSIALFIAGQFVIAQVATRGAAAKPIPTQGPLMRPITNEAATEDDAAAAEEAPAGPSARDEEEQEPAADEQPQSAADDETQPVADEPAQQATEERIGTADGGGQAQGVARTPLAKQWTTVDLVWLCIAALIGYVLGRGSEAKPHTAADSRDPHAPDRSMPPSD
jgi:hypothetical protein